MKDWIKILSYSNVYEIEIKKSLLHNSGIDAVVVNARDSLFLFGDVELYVRAEDEKRAIVILKQFEGLTKINSFILKEPILKFQEYLKSKGLETIFKEKESEKYILENYELYVKNEDVEKAIPYLTGEKVDSWSKVCHSNTVRQVRYRVELLTAKDIETFVVKKRDSDYHLEDIFIYVKNDDLDKAKQILALLSDFEKIREYSDFIKAELKEDILGKKGIRALIEKKESVFCLYVLKSKKEEAEKILGFTSEWIETKVYNSLIDAESIILLLEENGIDASILTIRDSVFIIGGYAIYVEKKNLAKTMEIISNSKGGVISE